MNIFKKLFGKKEESHGFDVQEVATFVHQFRAPITALKWVFESLQKAKMANEDQDMVKTGVQTSEHLSQMVDDILNLAKLEAGGMELNFEKINLVTFIEIALSDAIPFAKTYGVELLEDHPQEIEINVRADQFKLGMIVSNLLDNAIKYNRPGGSVTVLMQKKEKEALVSVKDTGIGVPPEALNNLFRKFYRADNAKQSGKKGTGFGLYIVKEIVEKLGGKIWVESTLNKGTTFYFTLPLHA